jgi:SAM-dependent methyltransferase
MAYFTEPETPLRKLRQRLFGLLHRGSALVCPFCERHFSRFLPGGSRAPEVRKLGAIGIGRRQNARCPHCGSNDRARLLLLYLKSTECFGAKKLRVLEIGPDRHLAFALSERPNIEYLCGSLYPEDFADIGGRKIDVTDIPFDDNSFDVLLCNHVLQQVPDDKKAMREVSRVLKPEGWGILQVPLAAKLTTTLEDLRADSSRNRRKRFGSTLHVRIYGGDYALRLREQNLSVEETHPVKGGWCKDAGRYATIPEETIFVVRKARSAA